MYSRGCISKFISHCTIKIDFWYCLNYIFHKDHLFKTTFIDIETPTYISFNL